MEEKILAPVAHRQYVFTVPRPLRPVVSRHRAWLGDLVSFHPHVHVFSADGTFVPLPAIPEALLERGLRRAVLDFPVREGAISDELHDRMLGNYDISSLKVIRGGGAAMPEAVAQKPRDLTGFEYVEGYGLSETIAPTHINPPRRPMRQCLGIPIFDCDCRIVDRDPRKEVGVGEVGEIVSQGPQVLKGYWKNHEATEEAFIEIEGKRFFRTGDLARMDEDGYFFMVDRLKRMINASGLKVWPAEVEAMMYAHPDIQEACVIGALDAYRGETVTSARSPPSSRSIVPPCTVRCGKYRARLGGAERADDIVIRERHARGAQGVQRRGNRAYDPPLPANTR